VNLQPTNYPLWWQASPSVAVYVPIKKEDCICIDEDVQVAPPKSLLARSLFLLRREQDFIEIFTLQEPVLKAWHGMLPSCTPFRHVFRLTKLTGWEGKDSKGKAIIPFKLKGMSHELCCLYHLKRDDSCVRLVFRIQVGAPEKVAIQLSEKIVNEMKNIPSHQGDLLVRPDVESYKKDLWAEFVAIHLEEMLREKSF
jgi:hypothetical protein